MIQMKDRKSKYRNATTKRKAAFCGCGFSINSKTFSKAMNSTKQIIQRNQKNHTDFFRQLNAGGDKNA